jgi:hypothetical protein
MEASAGSRAAAARTRWGSIIAAIRSQYHFARFQEVAGALRYARRATTSAPAAEAEKNKNNARRGDKSEPGVRQANVWNEKR